MQTNETGFTLIELMIVVLIIGILVALGLPSYQNYLRQSKYAEVIAVAAPAKVAVEMCIHQNFAAAPCDAGAQGIPVFGGSRYVSTVAITDGVITVTPRDLEGLLPAHTYILRPNGGPLAAAQDGGVQGATATATAATTPIRWAVEGGCIGAGLCRSLAVAAEGNNPAPPANPAQP